MLVPIFNFSKGSKVIAAAYGGLPEQATFSLHVRNQLGQFSPFWPPQCCPVEVITSSLEATNERCAEGCTLRIPKC